MPLEHEPLRLVQGVRLAEDLLRDRELAEVVEIAGEPGQLDRRLVRAEAACDSRRVLADPLRMAARVGIALVDRLRQALRRPVLRGAVRRVRKLLEIGPEDRLGRVGADAVLAVLLRPVQRAVREPDQLVAPGRPASGTSRRLRSRSRGPRPRRRAAATRSTIERATAVACRSSCRGRRTANSSPPSRKPRRPAAGARRPGRARGRRPGVRSGR